MQRLKSPKGMGDVHCAPCLLGSAHNYRLCTEQAGPYVTNAETLGKLSHLSELHFPVSLVALPTKVYELLSKKMHTKCLARCLAPRGISMDVNIDGNDDSDDDDDASGIIGTACVARIWKSWPIHTSG